jgi:hypothetical protein
MFLRIFTYRVQPQLRDRHLAIQQRAAKLYKRYLDRPPRYFRRSSDNNVWVELHEYPDRATCKRIADAIDKDKELATLWSEFQGTFDPAYPVRLDEFDEYEIPSPPNMAPIAQPPIDAAPVNAAPVNAAPPAVVEAVEVKPIDNANRERHDAVAARQALFENAPVEQVDPRGTLRPTSIPAPPPIPPVLPDDVLEVADDDPTQFSDRG